MKHGRIDKSKKQIVLSISGGLGNQLWQLASAYQLMLKYNMDEILIDLRSYENDRWRKFELDSYELPGFVKTLEIEKKQLFIYDMIRFFYSKIRGLLFYITNKYVDNKIHFFYKKGYFVTHNNPINVLKIRSSTIYMSGYYQNIENIENVLKDFLKFLKPRKEYLSKEFVEFKSSLQQEEKYTAMSVRCGKDFQLLRWNICDKNYFYKALSYFGHNKVLVFSDDIDEARKMFEGLNIIFVPQFSPIEQIELMKYCDKFILSNSTFSYWGMLVSESNNKESIYPEKWFPYLSTKDADILFGNYKIM